MLARGIIFGLRFRKRRGRIRRPADWPANCGGRKVGGVT